MDYFGNPQFQVKLNGSCVKPDTETLTPEKAMSSYYL